MILERDKMSIELHPRTTVTTALNRRPPSLSGVVLWHVDDDRLGRLGVDLGGGGAPHPQHVARELHHGALQAQADAQERAVVDPEMEWRTLSHCFQHSYK